MELFLIFEVYNEVVFVLSGDKWFIRIDGIMICLVWLFIVFFLVVFVFDFILVF